jgi:hypothetical protein
MTQECKPLNPEFWCQIYCLTIVSLTDLIKHVRESIRNGGSKFKYKYMNITTKMKRTFHCMVFNIVFTESQVRAINSKSARWTEHRTNMREIRIAQKYLIRESKGNLPPEN